MKKYCLTACAKEKISKVKDIFLLIVSIILFLVVVSFTILLSTFIFGMIAQGVYILINGNLIGWPVEILVSGSFVWAYILIGALLIMLGGVIWEYIFEPTLRGIKKVVYILAKEDQHFECKIFEECKS